MRKTSAIVAVLLVFAIGCVAAFAADAPKYKSPQRLGIENPARFIGAEDVEGTAATRPSSWGDVRNFGASSVPPGSPGTQVGKTTYDYQHNGSTGRQIAVTGTNIQVTFMKGTLEQIALGRNVYWNDIPVNGALAPITLDNGTMLNALPFGDAGSLEGSISLPTGTRPGYTTIRALPSGRAIAFMHDAPDDTLVSTSGLAGVDNGISIGIFVSNFVTQPSGILLNEAIWPKGATSIVAGDTVIHMCATGSTPVGTSLYDPIYYWRGVQANTFIAWEPAVYIDSTALLSSVIEADPNSESVAIVWTRAISQTSDNWGGQTHGNIYYTESTDGGVSFGPQINISNQDTLSVGYWAYTDLDAVYDDDGTLHIIYVTRDMIDGDQGLGIYSSAPATLWEWNTVRQDNRIVSRTDWTNSCASEGPTTSGGVFNLLIAKPNITVKPAGVHGIAEEILYSVWVQFGPTDTPDFAPDCATGTDSVTYGGWVNGEIYCSASSNDGLTWDRPFNLTGTVTDSCLPGDCHSEHWVTAATRADSAIYISYLDDTHAGGIVQDEGAWSTSPYMVYAPEARTPVLEPRISVTPTDFVELNVNSTGTPDTVRVTVNNVGNADLMYTATVTTDNGGASFVLVNGLSSTNSTILAAAAPETLVIVFDGNGLPQPSEQNWRLEVTSNDALNDPGQGGAAIDINLNVFVADSWFVCTRDTISTGQRRLAVTSCLEIGDQGGNGGLYAYADEREWIYDASPTLAYRPSAGVATVYRDVFYNSAADRSRANNAAFRAQSDILVHRDTMVSNGMDMYLADHASGTASSTDSIFQIDWTATTFKDPELVNGAVFHYSVSSMFTDGLGGSIVLGAAVDLDVDSLSAWNEGIASESKQYVGAQGGYGDTSGFVGLENYAALFYVPLDSACSDVADGAQVLDNVDYIYIENGYHTDSLLAWFETNIIGWGAQTETADTATDVNVLLKDRGETWTNTETYEWSFGLAVSDLGVSDLEENIARLRTAANSACLSGCPIETTGDVNLSTTITSADIIFLVGYVFKGGPDPQPCAASGDVNCSNTVTSADIIYLVGHVFKGGDPPCDACTGSTLAGEC